MIQKWVRIMKKRILSTFLLLNVTLSGILYASPYGFQTPEKSASIPGSSSVSYSYSDKTNITFLESGMADEYDFSAIKKIVMIKPHFSNVRQLQDNSLQNALMNIEIKCAKVLKREAAWEGQESSNVDAYIKTEFVQYQGEIEEQNIAFDDTEYPTQVKVKFGVYDAKSDKMIFYLYLSCEKTARNSGNKAFEGVCKEFFKQFKQELNKPVKQNPQKMAEKLTDNAITYIRNNEFKKAVAELNKAIEISPKHASAYNIRGVAYIKLEDYPKAIADFSQAISLNPKYDYAYCNRGHAYADLQDYPKAIADYSQAISLNPKYDDAYYNRGNAYANLQDYQKAIADYSQAIALNPQYIKAYNNRGVAYKAIGEVDKANADFAKAKDLEKIR